VRQRTYLQVMVGREARITERSHRSFRSLLIPSHTLGRDLERHDVTGPPTSQLSAARATNITLPLLRTHHVMVGTSVHLLPDVAIHSVALSGKSFFMLDSSGAFIKASLEMHALSDNITKN